MRRSFLVGNQADRGAGVFVQLADAVKLRRAVVAFNSATTNGGGIYVEALPPVFDIGSSAIFGNLPDDVFEQ
ncbi:MAG: hypothetical protein AAF628_22830 [Planctomycetota bacterium]